MTLQSDNARPPPDAPARSPGPGLFMTFRCAACGNARSVLGRRLRRVAGLRQYVCRGCVR